MAGHGQGKHHIPLVRQQVAAEAEDGLDHCHHKGGGQGQHEARRNEEGHDAQEIVAQRPLIFHHVEPKIRGACHDGQQHGDQVQGEHHPGRGPELMFQ